MELNIENIKALEPGKVYVLEVNFFDIDLEVIRRVIEEAARSFDIRFIVIDKNTMEIKSVPDGYDLVKKG